MNEYAMADPNVPPSESTTCEAVDRKDPMPAAVVGSVARWPWRTCVGAWVVSRVVVLATLLATRIVFDDATGERARVLDRGLRSWDGAFYADIARGGYDAVDPAGLRFFPLLPLLGRGLAAITPLAAGPAVVVVANLMALGALFAIERLVAHEYGAATARVAVWIAALAPPAFVLVMGYAESTLMVAATLALLAARRHRFGQAGLWCMVGALARPTGLLLVVPMAIELARSWRARPAPWSLPTLLRASFGLAGAPLGIGLYLVAVRSRTATLLEPLRIHDRPSLRGGVRNPLAATADALGDLIAGDRFASGVHFLTIVVLVVLMIVLWRHAPRSFFAYGLVSMVLAVSANNLDSLERYSLATVPFVVAAAIAIRRSRREVLIVIAMATTMVGFAAASFAGELVP